MRVWSCPSKPSWLEIWRARWRATTTSCSYLSATVSRGLLMRGRFSTAAFRSTIAENHDAHVVAAPIIVPIQHASDERGMPHHETRVRGQIPVGAEAVRVQDQQRASGPREGKFPNPMQGVSDGAVVRGEMTIRGAPFDARHDVAHSGENTPLRVRSEAGYGESGAPG